MLIGLLSLIFVISCSNDDNEDASLLIPTMILSQGNHNCVLLNNRSIKCWGDSQFGQLGQGNMDKIGDGKNEMGKNLPPINLGSGRRTKAMAVGGHHACVILDDDSVKCWGGNSSGQLGTQTTDALGDGENEMGDNLLPIDLGLGITAMSLATGEKHTCALFDDNTVKCWGDNTSGQLGQGNTNNLGDEKDEMGDNLSTIDLGSGRTAQFITARFNHTCVLLLGDDSIKCWGDNGFGQLGQGNTDHIGDGADEMGDNLPPIDLGTGRSAKSIAAGKLHTCALLDNNSLKCWGHNQFGQLGQGHTDDLGDGPDEMGDNLPLIDLGTGRSAKSIATGSNHTCALLDNNSVKCWGHNPYGQLGQGNMGTLGGGQNEMGSNLLAIDLGTDRRTKSISVGSNHSCSLLDNNTLKCWGHNNSGQLGQGHTDNLGDGNNEMGDRLPAIKL